MVMFSLRPKVPYNRFIVTNLIMAVQWTKP